MFPDPDVSYHLGPDLHKVYTKIIIDDRKLVNQICDDFGDGDRISEIANNRDMNQIVVLRILMKEKWDVFS